MALVLEGFRNDAGIDCGLVMEERMVRIKGGMLI